MDTNLELVVILTVGFALASLFAYIMQKLRLPTILGFLLAGYIIGPYSPGFVANTAISEQLAEIGVILMLFGVGLHFKIEDLINVKNIALPGAIGQMLIATVVSVFLIHLYGGSFEVGIIIGLSISVASTVVLVRVLSDNGLLNTIQGHISVGWLIVEDIFTVIMLILLPSIAGSFLGDGYSMRGLIGSLLIVAFKFFALVILIVMGGHRVVEYLLTGVARLRSHELFTLAVLATVFSIALGAAFIFGTSIALGAFIAGMVIGKTNVRHQAAANSLPLKDTFAIIFFLSVGMLFNPHAIWEHLGLFLIVLFVIFIVKPLAASLVTFFLGCPARVTLTVSIALAQIGEFSFILAEEAMRLDLLPEEGFDILVACALVSISLNPLLFRLLHPIEQMIQKWPSLSQYKFKATHKRFERIKASPKIVVIGFGSIGKAVTKILQDLHFSPIIIENNIDVAKPEPGKEIIFGDAALESILKDAHVGDARLLIVTIKDTQKTLDIVQAAKHLNPSIQIVARVEKLKDKESFNQSKIHYVCSESENLRAFTAIVRYLLQSKKGYDHKTS